MVRAMTTPRERQVTPRPPLLGTASKLSVFRAVVRRSGPHLLEATLVPGALFYCFLVLMGLGAAFVVALVWSYAAVAVRLLRHRPIPPLLVLGVIGISIRTVAAMATGSTFVYFAQPILNGVVMALVFIASVVIGRPLIERLAFEFWPLTPDMVERPAVARLFRSLTLLWAGVNLATAASTLLLYFAMPLATFVAIKQLASLGITALAVILTIDWSLRTARREGLVSAAATVPAVEAAV
jgi:intracellular septation protein A